MPRRACVLLVVVTALNLAWPEEGQWSFSACLEAVTSRGLETAAAELALGGGAVLSQELGILYDGVAFAYTTGNADQPNLVLVVEAEGASPWSSALWLSVMQRLGNLDPDDGGAMFLATGSRDGPADYVEPGSSPWKEHGPVEAAADGGDPLVLILDLDGFSGSLAVRAEASGRLAPRDALDTLRTFLADSGVPHEIFPVEMLFAKAGLAQGWPDLEPWLDAGLRAFALEAIPDGISHPVDQAEHLATAIAGLAAVPSPAPESPAFRQGDVNYLAYPLPGTTLIVSDHALTVLILITGAAALGFAFFAVAKRAPDLPDRRRRERAGREALAAFALAGGAALAATYLGRAAVGLAPSAASETGPWVLTIRLGVRLLSFLSAYFALSGFAVRLGILSDVRRATAARAASLGFSAVAVASVLFFPAAAPWAFACAVAAGLGGVSPLSSGVLVTAAAGVLLPFLVPLAVGNYPDIVLALLRGGARSALIQAVIAAPFTLWLASVISGKHRLRRGRKPAFLFALGPLAAAAVEYALVRFG